MASATSDAASGRHSPTAAYVQTLETLGKFNLGFVAQRLPPKEHVASSVFDEVTSTCTVTYHEEMNVGVSRAGTLMPGATVVVKREMTMRVLHTAKKVEFTGLEAGILGNTFGGRVDSVEARDGGDIRVNASTGVWPVRVPISQTFNPGRHMELLGWRFDTNEVQVEYAARPPARADSQSAAGQQPSTSGKSWFSWG